MSIYCYCFSLFSTTLIIFMNVEWSWWLSSNGRFLQLFLSPQTPTWCAGLVLEPDISWDTLGCNKTIIQCRAYRLVGIRPSYSQFDCQHITPRRLYAVEKCLTTRALQRWTMGSRVSSSTLAFAFSSSRVVANLDNSCLWTGDTSWKSHS